MKIVIASDSYKESLSSLEVANCIEKGFKKVFPEALYEKVALADGGEGTLSAILQNRIAREIHCQVHDPLMRKIDASYVWIEKERTAFIEMATASGLELLSMDERNPLKATSFGFGELILDAISEGAKRLVLGIGGSATNDAGIGMLQALGVKFYNNNDELIIPTAQSIPEIVRMDTQSLKKFLDVDIQVACDVNNPLCGASGASLVFGAQKGASPSMIQMLDKNLQYFAMICQKELLKNNKYESGSGAAGGMGFALMTFLNAKLKKGIDLILEEVELKSKLQGASLVITGEGQIDRQTAFGKTPIGVAKLAKTYDLPVIAIAGSLSKGYEKVYEEGIDMVFDITPKSLPLKELLSQASSNLENTAYNIARALKLSLLPKCN